MVYMKDRQRRTLTHPNMVCFYSIHDTKYTDNPTILANIKDTGPNILVHPNMVYY